MNIPYKKSIRKNKMSSLILQLILKLFYCNPILEIQLVAKYINIVRVELNERLNLCKIFYSNKKQAYKGYDSNNETNKEIKELINININTIKKEISKKLYIKKMPNIKFITTNAIYIMESFM